MFPVTYDGCFEDTTGGAMNILTGSFKVAKPGYYSISFTAKFVSSNRGRYGAWADLYLNNTVRVESSNCQRLISLKKTNCFQMKVLADTQREFSSLSERNSETSTHSMFVISPLRKNDMVIRMGKNEEYKIIKFAKQTRFFR